MSTEIVVILDRSGSMQSAKSDHEGGLRSFVEDQKKLDGDVRFTLIQFDSVDPREVVYDGVRLDEVKDITLVPRGGTPLLDAIGLGVAHVTERINKASTKPEVICMIITDGEENSSTEFSLGRVKQLLADKEKDNWSFLFLGANIDAFATSGALGMSQHMSASFVNNSAGVKGVYAASSGNVLRSRMLQDSGLDRAVYTSALSYTDEQRAQMSAEGDAQ